MNIFTKDEEQKIITMYENKISIDDIIKAFNCKEKDIRLVLKNNNIDRCKNMFSEEIYDRIMFLYQNNHLNIEIADELLISVQTIGRLIKKRGIDRIIRHTSNRIYSLDEHYFDEINSPNKAYLLGLLYADGCNHLDHHSITLSLQEEDRDVVEFMKRELNYGGPIRINKLHDKNERYKNQCILCINSAYMSKRLEQLGVVNAKSLVLTFPDWLDLYLYPYFIAGYFDGDGCVSYDEKHQKCYTKTAGTMEFCAKLSEILSDIGCKHHIIHPKQCKDSNTYVIQTGGNKSSLKLLDYIYDNDGFHMNRKYQKYLYFKEKYLTKNNTQAA